MLDMKRIRLSVGNDMQPMWFTFWLDLEELGGKGKQPTFTQEIRNAALMTPEQAEGELAAIRAARPLAALVVEDAQ
jgi:hypothetical protein